MRHHRKLKTNEEAGCFILKTQPKKLLNPDPAYGEQTNLSEMKRVG